MRERRVQFAPEALEDLRSIYDWIANAAGSERALGYIERIEVFCSGMGSASERGHLRDDIRPGLRITGFERRLTIAFTVSEQSVTILRLFHAGRDWEGAMQ